MKKTIIVLTIVSILLPMSIVAQLKVTSDGTVGVALSNPVAAADLSVSHNDGYYYNQYAYGIRADRRTDKTFNIGVAGRSIGTSHVIGLQGVAGGSLSGYNYGVIGGLTNSNINGAGIFGTTLNHTGVQISGRYAGYFNGHVYVDSTITAASFISPSDIRIKQNIEALNENCRAGSTLENVLNMNVVKYNYTDFHKYERSDTAATDYREQARDITSDTHYGLIAQELQTIYPDLVKEGQDGYLGINYVELVPILIRSIQELKAELDEVRASSEDTFNARSTSALNTATSSSAKLYQNTPNPFTERTVIRFSLPDDAINAYIYIFDLSGKMLRQIPINSSMQSVTVNGSELSAGIYLYSLLIKGQEIDTKKMIITK